jgi:anti-sigma factor RsiW
VDGELLDDDRASVNGHVARCDACRQRLGELAALKAALSSAGRAVELPPGLEDRLRLEVRRAARPARLVRLGLVAGAALALAVAVGVTASQRHPTRTPQAVIAALQRHRAELPVDVASPDPRPVQEFLSQRLGHRMRVPRLDGLGFGLHGGRVVDVDDRQGAQLSYRGGYGQRLSVLAVPDPDGALAARVLSGGSSFASSSDGLSVRVLHNGGALYTIIGDVDEHRLERLSHELER